MSFGYVFPGMFDPLTLHQGGTQIRIWIQFKMQIFLTPKTPWQKNLNQLLKGTRNQPERNPEVSQKESQKKDPLKTALAKDRSP